MQRSITALSGILGIPVQIEPEWPILWVELQNVFPDPGTFVPSVASVVSSWCTSLAALAEDDSNEAWTEALLEHTGTIRLTASIEVRDLTNPSTRSKVFLQIGGGRPSTRWIESRKRFAICLTKSHETRSANNTAGFHDDFRSIFKPPLSELPLRSTGLAAIGNEEPSTEIDTLDFDSASILTPTTTDLFHARSTLPDALPDVNTIERPEDLMLKPPYHMIIHPSSTKNMSLECSHQPSLELLAEYLKRWSKRNYNNVNHVCCLRFRYFPINGQATNESFVPSPLQPRSFWWSLHSAWDWCSTAWKLKLRGTIQGMF